MAFDSQIADGLFIKMEPVLPHGDDRKPAAEEHRRQHRGTSWPDDRDIKDGSQCRDTGVAHRIDADGVEPLFLRRLADFEDADIGEHHIGLADVIAWRRLRRPECETQFIAQIDSIQLRPALRQILFRHGKGNNYQNIFHRLPILCHAGTSPCFQEVTDAIPCQ